MLSRKECRLISSLILFISIVSFGSQSGLNLILSKAKVKKLNKSGTIFVIDGLRYQISFAAADRIGTIQVTNVDDNPFLCVNQAHESAKTIVNELQPLGSDLGRDQIEAIPTSGKRRYSQKYEKGVEVVSIFKKQDACDLFDRLTFFYWIPIKGKIKSKYIDHMPALANKPLQRFIIVVAGKKLELDEKDFQTVKKGEIVEVEYMMSNSLAKIVRY
jgi:hypothetical protein